MSCVYSIRIIIFIGRKRPRTLFSLKSRPFLLMVLKRKSDLYSISAALLSGYQTLFIRALRFQKSSGVSDGFPKR